MKLYLFIYISKSEPHFVLNFLQFGARCSIKVVLIKKVYKNIIYCAFPEKKKFMGGGGACWLFFFWAGGQLSSLKKFDT